MPERRSKWMRRFIARYVVYLEIFGYIFVGAVTLAIAALFFFTVDDTAQANSNPLIKPNEHEVTRNTDAVVLSVLVANHADVAKGQPLVEVCDDSLWVRRYQSAERSDSLAAALDLATAGREPTPDERALREALRKAAERWSGEKGRMPRTTLRSPVTGVVVVGEGLKGKILAEKKEIARVIDFDDLRISGDLRAANVHNARVGQPIKAEVLMTYGDGEIMRVDFDRTGQWRWKKRHGQYNTLTDGRITEIVLAHYKGRTVTLEEDTAFAVTKVVEVDLSGVLKVDDAGAPGPGEAIEAEPFADLVIRGHVVEGTHTVQVRMREFPPEVQVDVEKALMERLKGQVIRSLEGSPFSVKSVKNLVLTVKLDGDDKGVKKAREAGFEPILADKLDRKFVFEAKIDDPPAALKTLVREMALASTPTYVKTKTEVVVGQRRIAMLLFRKD